MPTQWGEAPNLSWQVGSGVVDGRTGASGAGKEDVRIKLTAGGSEGHKGSIGSEGWCDNVVGGKCHCS